MIEPCVRSLEHGLLNQSRPSRCLGTETASIWLDCLPEKHVDRGLYLVNGSDEVLTWVKSVAISTITIEDDAFGAGGSPLATPRSNRGMRSNWTSMTASMIWIIC
jgi:hypothetical protein